MKLLLLSLSLSLPLFLSVSLISFMHPWHLEKYACFVLMVSFITLFQYLFSRGETYSASWKNQTMAFPYSSDFMPPCFGCTHYLVLHRGNTQTLSFFLFLSFIPRSSPLVQIKYPTHPPTDSPAIKNLPISIFQGLSWSNPNLSPEFSFS